MMVKISVGRDLILVSEALLSCVVHLGTTLVESPRSYFGRALGFSVHVGCHYVWQSDLLALTRHLLLLPQPRLRRGDGLGADVAVVLTLRLLLPNGRHLACVLVAGIKML